MGQPDSGVVMKGCGGLRKLRVADPGDRKASVAARDLYTCMCLKQT